MPFDTIDGIIINVYSVEHPPPHIHAIYNEYEALVVIETSAKYAGELPNAQYRAVVKWLATGHNREDALMTFNTLNPQLIRKQVKKETEKKKLKGKKSK